MQPQRPRQRRLGCPSRRTDRKRKKPNKLAAVVQAVVMLASFFAGVAVQAWLPWQELPLRWVLLAVALNTAFFIGHDCVHGTWTSSPLINTIVGEICFTPLLHPYQAFKHLHLTHVVTDKVVGQASDGTALHIDSQKAHTVSLLAEIGLVRFFGQLYLPWKFPVEVRARVTASILFSLVLVSAATVVCVQLVGPHAPLTCWLIPLVLYKDLFFISLLTFLRNRIHVLLPHQLATRIASYHLFSASFIIREVINDDAFGGEGNGKSTGKAAAPYVPPPHRSRIAAADWEKRPLLQRLNWVHLFILTVLPVTSVWGCLSTPLHRNTAWWAFCYYLFTGAAAAAVELSRLRLSTLEYCRADELLFIRMFYRFGHYSRLSSLVGTSCLQRISPCAHLPLFCWHGCDARLHQVVVLRPQSTSPLHRLRFRSVRRKEGLLVVPLGMDAHAAQSSVQASLQHL